MTTGPPPESPAGEPAIAQGHPIPPAQPHPAPGMRFWWGVFAAICVLCALPGLFMGLHADDWFHARPRSMGEVLATFAGDWNEGVSGEGGFYRPLVRVSFFFDHMFHGGSAIGCHLTNGILFSLVLLALFLAGLEFFPNRPGTILFVIGVGMAFHPLKNEALYWVSGRTDLLAAGFVFWSLWAGMRALRRDSPRWAALSLALLTGALLSKEVALSACLAIPAMAGLISSRGFRNRATLLLVTVPPVLGVVYFALRSMFLGGLAGYAAGDEMRTVGELAGNFAVLFSALAAPWQAESAAYSPVYTYIGAVILIFVLLAFRLRRGIVAMALGMLIMLLPMIFIRISPPDGNRVLLTALGFQVLLAIQVFAGPWFPGWMRPAAAFVAVLVAFSLQPSNMRQVHRFIEARAANQGAIESLWDWVETASDGEVLLLPAVPHHSRVRILNPGESALMAMETLWLRRGGTATAHVVDTGAPHLYLRLERDGITVRCAEVLQPWIEQATMLAFDEELAVEGQRVCRRDDPRDIREMIEGDEPYALAPSAGAYTVIEVVAEGPLRAGELTLHTAAERTGLSVRQIDLPAAPLAIRWVMTGPESEESDGDLFLSPARGTGRLQLRSVRAAEYIPCSP